MRSTHYVTRHARRRALPVLAALLAAAVLVSCSSGTPESDSASRTSGESFEQHCADGRPSLVDVAAHRRGRVVVVTWELPRVVAEAFHIARTGRPGPVHIDITKDALQQETRAEHPTEAEVIAGLPGFRPNLEGHGRQLKSAAAEIAAAQRPVILAGHGVLHAEAWDDLVGFAENPVDHHAAAHLVLEEGAGRLHLAIARALE